MFDFCIYGNIFRIDGLISLWSREFTIFQSSIPRLLLSNSKAMNTCEKKKSKQSLSVSK